MMRLIELTQYQAYLKYRKTPLSSDPVNKHLLKGKCWDYSPTVQRPYGLGVAKTLLRGWQHRQVCVLDLGL